jgi:hypothetical protein
MTPRRTDRKGSRRPGTHERPFGIRTHWRADGNAKTAFPTQRAAADAADERRRESGIVLNVYLCDFCSGWHMGTVSPRDQ